MHVLCVRVLIFITIHISRPVQKRKILALDKKEKGKEKKKKLTCMRKGQAVVRTYRVSEIGTYFSLPFSNFTARGNKKTTKKRARGQSYNVNTLTYINTFFFSFQTLQKKREGSEK
jgi:hypothetical protein